jgi:5-(carboxyamino)imidazole ribonucleotide mutase
MKQSIVAIVMGSDSDLPIMQEAAQVMDDFGVPYEIAVVSAHRSPDIMFEFSKTACKRGLKVIISGAGGAAHAPGMVAALTTLPVIGVPIMTKTLNGVDSLYSIVQMPPGIPVATVGINGSKNAALLALKILAIEDKKIRTKLENYMEGLKKSVVDKSAKLAKIGYKEYVKSMIG